MMIEIDGFVVRDLEGGEVSLKYEDGEVKIPDRVMGLLVKALRAFFDTRDL